MAKVLLKNLLAIYIFPLIMLPAIIYYSVDGVTEISNFVFAVTLPPVIIFQAILAGRNYNFHDVFSHNETELKVDRMIRDLRKKKWFIDMEKRRGKKE